MCKVNTDNIHVQTICVEFVFCFFRLCPLGETDRTQMMKRSSCQMEEQSTLLYKAHLVKDRERRKLRVVQKTWHGTHPSTVLRPWHSDVLIPATSLSSIVCRWYQPNGNTRLHSIHHFLGPLTRTIFEEYHRLFFLFSLVKYFLCLLFHFWSLTSVS